MGAGIIASSRLLGLTGGGGGGGPPARLVFSDFKNGAYELSGSSATVADIWEHNTNWYAWNSSSIIAGTGLKPGTTNANPAMIASVLSVVSPSGVGFVVVADITIPSSATATQIEWKQNVGFSWEAYVNLAGIDWIYCYGPDTGDYEEVTDTGSAPIGNMSVAIEFGLDHTTFRTSTGYTNTSTSSTGSGLDLHALSGNGASSCVIIRALTYYPLGTDLASVLV